MSGNFPVGRVEKCSITTALWGSHIQLSHIADSITSSHPSFSSFCNSFRAQEHPSAVHEDFLSQAFQSQKMSFFSFPLCPFVPKISKKTIVSILNRYIPTYGTEFLLHPLPYPPRAGLPTYNYSFLLWSMIEWYREFSKLPNQTENTYWSRSFWYCVCRFSLNLLII